MSSQNDPYPQGGDLSEMAASGTTVPSDAAEPRLIPSKPRPGQTTSTTKDPNNFGSVDLAGAADNAQDFSRTTRDNAPTTDVMTGTGDSLPAEVGSKRLHNVVQGDLSKGHGRFDKHVQQKGSDLDKEASEGATEEEVRDGVVGGR